MAEMKDIVSKAKARRADLLMAFRAAKTTIKDFANDYPITEARIGQLLKRARKEEKERKRLQKLQVSL